MHELGVLLHIAKTVGKISKQNHIRHVRFIALEVGETSGFVPKYLHKLFPAAADLYSELKKTQLRIFVTPGKGLLIKEIGY